MSIAIHCDSCRSDKFHFVGEFDETIEEILKRAISFGWSEQDFGHTCKKCTISILEAQELEDSQDTPIELIAHRMSEDE